MIKYNTVKLEKFDFGRVNLLDTVSQLIQLTIRIYDEPAFMSSRENGHMKITNSSHKLGADIQADPESLIRRSEELGLE